MRLRILLLNTLIFTAGVAVTAQPSQSTVTEWTRVRSDNGEFTVEVPKKNKHYGSKAGFTIGRSFGDSYVLADMNMVNAFAEGTLISVESYNAFEGALNAIYERDAFRKADIETTKIKFPGYAIRQITKKTNEFYMIRRYFNSKNQIYILTAASRTGETAALRRFLDSVEFTPEKKKAEADKFVAMSSLPQDEPGVEILDDKPVPSPRPASPVGTADPASEKLIFVHKQAPSYTGAARQKGVTGNIRVRATFSADGWISNLSLYETLDGGLLRQTLFAVIRIKFLPQQSSGNPISVVKTLEYSFDIY